MAELRANNALAEHKNILQSNVFRNIQDSVRGSMTDARVGITDTSAANTGSAEHILPAIAKSVENKVRLSATLKEQATNKARTLHNGSCTSSIESLHNTDAITQGKILF